MQLSHAREVRRAGLVSAALLAAPLGLPGQTPAPGCTIQPANTPTMLGVPLRRLACYVAADSANAGAASIVSDGRIAWEGGFGFEDPRHQRAATAQSIFPTASLSKSLTATLAMVLAEHGALALDRPVRDYLGADAPRQYAGTPGELTVQSLLAMRGGIPHVVRFYYDDEPGGPVPNRELVRRFGFVALEPGKYFHYSNMSFGVLESVIETVTHQSYDDAARARLFAPLGMAHTVVAVPDSLRAFEAQDFSGTGVIPVAGLQPFAGAGVHSSAHDLALLATALLRAYRGEAGAILGRASVRAMWRIDGTDFYGLGWWRGPTVNGYATVIADGKATGGSATLIIAPDAGTAAAVLFSTGAGDSYEMANAALEAVLKTRPRFAGKVSEVEVGGMRDTLFVPTSAWIGHWAGVVHTSERAIPIGLDIDTSGVRRISFDADSARPVARWALDAGMLEFPFDGAIATAETAGHPHSLSMLVRPDGSVLRGYVTATSKEQRTRFVLPYFVELSRRVVSPRSSE